jgi:hypothetical protein
MFFSVAHFFAPSKPFIASGSSGSSKYFSTLSFATMTMKLCRKNLIVFLVKRQESLKVK